MPAIQLARLKLQTGQLRDNFSQPAVFVRGLRDMLEFYANRTHRAGQSGEPPPLIHSYNVPAPVLRQILLEVTQPVMKEPLAAEALIDKLWEQENLECRWLAISILGMLPVQPFNPVIERLEKWIIVSEERLVDTLLDKGLERIRKEDPTSFLKLIRGWITSEDRREQQLGLRALVPPIKEGSFEELPVLFRLVTPLVRNTPSFLRPSLITLIAALASRSPLETVYFLRENLEYPDTPWLIRRVIGEFPPALQETLKSAMRSSQRSEE